MTATDQLTDTFNALKQAVEAALVNQNAEDFATFEKYLADVDAYARETQQAMWSDEAKQAIKRLEKNDPLTETDLDVIRVFLVSDAEHYLAVENNYGDWLNELKRLASDLQTRARTCDRHSIGELRGVLKDAIRLVPDIRNYLEQQERVHKLDQAMQALDQNSRDMLANLLREQLRSEKR
jgi:hypothetical protein